MGCVHYGSECLISDRCDCFNVELKSISRNSYTSVDNGLW